MTELTIHNAEWILSRRHTMAMFVDAIVVTDLNHVYRSYHGVVLDAVQRGNWDDALGAALRLRKYAYTAADRDGEKRATLLASFAFIALQRHREADQSLSLMFGGEVEPLDLWHGALAHIVRGMAAYAQGYTIHASIGMEIALNYLDCLADWTTQDRFCHSQCSPSRKVAQRLACDADHIRLRETLRVTLQEVIGRLAVMEGRRTDDDIV